MATYKRRKKLIKPSLQLWLTSTFVGLSALSLLLQFVLFQSRVSEAALELPNDSARMFEIGSSMTLEVLAVSFLAFLPLTFLVGVLTTFRIAGPIYRFEQFLNQVRRGENPPDFRLRKKDRLHDFADLLNEVTRPLRQGPPAGSAEGTAESGEGSVATSDEDALETPPAPLPADRTGSRPAADRSARPD